MITNSLIDHLSSLLARLHVFSVEGADLVELASICSYLSVPGGVCVFAEGEESDAIYVILTGIFGAYRQAKDGQEDLLNRMGVGEIIGEVGFITGQPRTATVRALRNGELLRFSREDLQAVAARCPSVLFAICGTLVTRLQKAQGSLSAPYRPRNFCLVPSDAVIDIQTTVVQFVGSLRAFGKVVVVSRDQASQHTSGWFMELEQTFDFIVFLGEFAPSVWTRFCLRQCDCVLLVAQADAKAVDFVALGPDRVHASKGIPLDLILLWQDKIDPSKTTGWLKVIKPRAHYHVRSTVDVGRVARLVTGRGIGLVLSGGGARGLAHVGVITALRQSGIPVDVVGGTSIGGVVAASIALEWDPAALAQSFVKAFARARITDYAVPRVALFSERRFDRTIGRWFGELRIEDAPIPFFCVSSNLTDGCVNIHRTGRFAKWLQATTAIPGVFPPVIDNGKVYVDGGVLNNLPMNLIRQFGVGAVIAVDVGSNAGAPWRFGEAAISGNTRPSILELLWRVGTIGSDAVEEVGRRDCDVVLRPAVNGIGIFGWQACGEAIEAGRRIVQDRLAEIETAIAGATSPLR
jgi:NTE family protein